MGCCGRGNSIPFSTPVPRAAPDGGPAASASAGITARPTSVGCSSSLARVRSDGGKGHRRRDRGDDGSEQPRVHLRLLSSVMECRHSACATRCPGYRRLRSRRSPGSARDGPGRRSGHGYHPPGTPAALLFWRRPGGARMEQPDDRSSTRRAVARASGRARVAGAVTAVVVGACCAVAVIGLRAANDGRGARGPELVAGGLVRDGPGVLARRRAAGDPAGPTALGGVAARRGRELADRRGGRPVPRATSSRSPARPAGPAWPMPTRGRGPLGPPCWWRWSRPRWFRRPGDRIGAAAAIWLVAVAATAAVVAANAAGRRPDRCRRLVDRGRGRPGVDRRARESLVASNAGPRAIPWPVGCSPVRSWRGWRSSPTAST